VRRLYKEGHGDTSKAQPGLMYEHDLTTPIIEVARDGKTAKAVWFSPGTATGYAEGHSTKLKATWRYLKIGSAWAVEDGKWRLWKYHIYSTFFCDFYKSWVDYQPPGRGLVTALNPKPPTYDNPYRPDTAREEMPRRRSLMIRGTPSGLSS